MRAVANRVRRGVFRALGRAHADRGLVAAEFDARFYLRAYPDVAAAGVDPVEHFLESGWREGRDPTRWFSVGEYLEAYPDVAAAEMNPFVHFLRAGRAEGRRARQDLGFRYEILARLKTMDERMVEAARASEAVRPNPTSDLTGALASTRSGAKALHVTFSHDDYSTHVGGVQLCVRREAAAVERAGRDHLHIFPAKPWPALRDGEAALLGVVWNGRPAGAYPPETLISALRAAQARGASFALHSLLGHSVDEVTAILGAVGLKAGVFWLHDFASLCAGFHLLRDDVEDCAAPPPDSAGCGICVYGPWRGRHLKAHARLFAALDLTVASPSQSALELWRGASDLRARAEVVLPHARMVPRGAAPAARRETPLKVGFLGVAAAHKGWPVFRDLALRFADDRRYEFHHFGAHAQTGALAAFHPVSASGHEPQAMQRALETAQIDVALIWPLCRETFSFTAHEAAAAGAAVLTNPDSGNVAAFVGETGLGRVLADEAGLTEFFDSGEALALSRARRAPTLYDLEHSALTMDLIASEAGA